MKPHRITQKDIARRLGLSTSLVSRALAGTAAKIGADPRTVRRIQEAAEQLGYVPNAAARQLRGGGPPVVGLAVVDIGDPFFGPAMAEVIRQFHAAGFALTLTGFSHRRPEPADVRLLLQHDLCALLVLGSGDLDWVEPFVARGLPVIRIGGGEPRRGVRNVALDEAWGMALLVQHLVERGHRQIAFVGARLDVHEQRLQLLRSALQKHQLSLLPHRAILAGAEVLEAGERGVQELAREPGSDWPTAIICSSDAVALGVLRGVAYRGLRVPEHLSITGFDDLALARLSTPPLTSVRQPLVAMIGEALRLVERAGALTPPFPPHRPELVVRDSTGLAGSRNP